MSSSSSPFVAFAFESLDGVRAGADGHDPVRVAAEARAAGHAEGFAAGRAEALAALTPALQALAVAADELERERAASLDTLEAAAAELGVRVAERVLAGTLDVQPERVLDVIRGAMRSIVERERLTVLVSPEDLELVREASEALAGEMGGVARLDVQAERRVGRGGAILRTPDGEVDGSVATKLERVREVVCEELRAS